MFRCLISSSIWSLTGLIPEHQANTKADKNWQSSELSFPNTTLSCKEDVKTRSRDKGGRITISTGITSMTDKISRQLEEETVNVKQVKNFPEL